jgi:hypothetical protein
MAAGVWPAHASPRAVAIVEVLAHVELGAEQPSVVEHHTVEQPIELVGVDPMLSLH